MKTLYVISGANGSGKTTFAKSFAKLNELYFINADEIAKELDKDNITKYKIKAGKIFFSEFKIRLSLDKSFVIETTLSGRYLIAYIKKAKEMNFKVSLIYLFLENPQTNINRVKNRVLNGGHHIPKDDIIRRYYRSKNMFWNSYKDIVNNWSIYYNSDEIFEKIASDFKVLDEQKYKIFCKDIECN
ncbi:MAG: AAA family ATPase [Campylobacterota bacterium]|nr:AAA family ATPase [Campylobacterota bacterium]